MSNARPIEQNKLLNLLAPSDLALIEKHLHVVSLLHGEEVEAPDKVIDQVYFPISGLLSIVTTLTRERDIEVGVVGRDGMTGVAILQDDDRSPFSTFVQIKGSALQIEAALLRTALLQSPTLATRFHRYARAQTIQIASTALANGRSKLEDRLARWLLMVQDRIDSDRIDLTHEFLAVMLGVRRPGVTVALHILEGKGLIRSNRGEIVIRDRDGLIELADGAYGLPEREYQRLMGTSS
ncbi:MAG TPA: Crp/Fnr family transcriptional regulator [Devosiaceae bacterium]|jgi:CRP-like cAMP-binding protein